MKFVVSSTALYSHISSISRVINSKNALPILDCFLFQLKDNTLSITASDSETTVITTIEVSGATEDGSICFVAKNLLDSLKELSERPLEFNINLQTRETTIDYQNGRYNILGQDPEDFSTMPPLGDDVMKLALLPEVLSDGINSTLFASADDELRPVMNGVYFDIKEDSVTFVASDGHKLVRDRSLSSKGDTAGAFILPKKPAALLKTLLGKDGEEVSIAFDSRNAVIKFQDYVLSCRLIEGRYPNYNSVIPTGNPNKLVVDRLSLLGAMKRVSVFSSQSSSLIKLSIEEGKVTLSAQDIDYSTSAEETVVCDFAGSPLNIGFKSTFLVEILSNISAENVQIELSDPSRAGIVIPVEQKENNDLLMLLMPMMLND
jgi:DNA polymerase-3 subunit beta